MPAPSIDQVRRVMINGLVFTNHALERMVERNITVSDVRQIIQSPIRYFEHPKHLNKLRIDGFIDGKGYCGFAVAVGVSKNKQVAVIVTVFDKVGIKKEGRN